MFGLATEPTCCPVTSPSTPRLFCQTFLRPPFHYMNVSTVSLSRSARAPVFFPQCGMCVRVRRFVAITTFSAGVLRPSRWGWSGLHNLMDTWGGILRGGGRGWGWGVGDPKYSKRVLQQNPQKRLLQQNPQKDCFTSFAQNTQKDCFHQLVQFEH